MTQTLQSKVFFKRLLIVSQTRRSSVARCEIDAKMFVKENSRCSRSSKGRTARVAAITLHIRDELP